MAPSNTITNGKDKSSKETNNNMKQPEATKPTKPERSSSWIRNVLLTINSVLQTPFYGMMLCTALYFVLLYYSPPVMKTLLVMYWAWAILVDQDPSTGGWDEDTGRPLPWLQMLLPQKLKFHYKLRRVVRNYPLFKAVAEYFDMTLVKTTDLPPNQNYLFLYHPHGVIAMGANCGLSTNGCDFEKKFPGIHRSGAVLDKIFYAPFYREWLLMCGCIAPHRSTLKTQLTTTQPFYKSVVLIPGGAAEAMHAHPGVFRLHLKNRKGFIKVAMETGCSLVPCIGFGENEMFDTLYGFKDDTEEEEDEMSDSPPPSSPKSSTIRSNPWIKDVVVQAQHFAKQCFTFTVPVLMHIIPNRHTVTVVVGKPMSFTKTDTIKQEEVDKQHDLYLKEVKKLYDEHKQKYGMPGVELEIV